MVDPASTRSWGYAIPLGKIMLHYNINTGPGVLLSSSKIIRSRKFKERKSNRTASGSTGGRRKKVGAKKAAPVKEKSGSKKNKQSVESADPRSETHNEEDSASTSDRTASQNTEEDLFGKGKGPMDEEQSVSLENANTGADSLRVESWTKSTSKLARRPKYFLCASPPADQTINITDDRTEPPHTDLHASVQTGNSEPAVTEERVKTLIEEFVNDAVKPWKRKIKKAAVQAIKIAETTKDDLGEAVKRITSVETNYGDSDELYERHLRRTKELEAITPKMVIDLISVRKTIAEMERSQEIIGQRLTKVEEDLAQSVAQAGSTLDRVITLENKNATLEEQNTKLEADLKSVTEQVAELIEAKLVADKAIEEANAQAAKELQDALDEQNRTQKEAAWSDANFAEHIRRLTAKNPELAKTMAANQAEDANRLKVQQDTYTNFEKAHNKSQAAPSSSIPATRKRKATSNKAQMTGLLASVTETVVDPALQTEDDFEEDVQPQLRRHRVLDGVPIRTIGQ
ncbi:M protein, serotype 24-like [Impatiens glandulifera]|uniref:M protein, serotype 24-like n=1 Tax=Impatiens glandulifera TaxID=253017 RepID=UPI001FB071F9|nr:M protein, serotype 24-like [Impatiens glandulifera]